MTACRHSCSIKSFRRRGRPCRIRGTGEGVVGRGYSPRRPGPAPETPLMARKVVLLADPGFDTAFAVALALYDPQIDVLTVGATAGMGTADQATAIVHALVEH